MKIAQIVATVDARLGGPSVSIPRLARAFADAGNKVSLLSTHSQPEAPLTHGKLTTQVFLRNWPHSLSASSDFKRHLNCHDYDILQTNGVWLRPLHYAAAAHRKKGTPLVISPRGMLSPWSLGYHAWRRRLCERFVHPGALQEAQAFHATSKGEADDIRRLGFQQPICVAPNGIDRPDPLVEEQARRYWQKACPEAFERPTALFYSRFHRKKRVLELIELWSEEAPADWLLLIVGFPQEYSVQELREYALRAGGALNIVIFDGTDSPPPYAAASLFLQPSISEDHGQGVAEALAHGLPVLATDTTPWDCVNQTDYGWCGPWDMFRHALVDALALGHKTLRKRGGDAREWALQQFSWEKSAALLGDFYSSLLP